MASRKSSIRERVWIRAGGRCEYCLLAPAHDPRPFHVEHVNSKKHRGQTDFSNLALSCAGCNWSKASNIAGYDDLSGKLTRLFNPRVDEWGAHFVWVGPALQGKTAIGRTTVAVLDINHPERIRLRRFLIQLGVFPSRG